MKINNIDEIKNKLERIKKTYKDATHYCYAYIIDGKEKCSDNGEPSGTAGIPILNVLKQNNLTNIICIVIRYFGGIKLGAGGLVRAYTKSVVECLKDHIKLLIEGYNITITFEYKYICNIIDSTNRDYINKSISKINSKNNLSLPYYLYDKGLPIG